MSGWGGGAVLLQSGDRITIDGRIDTRAKRVSFSTGTTRRGAGGSGGSILLLATRSVAGNMTGVLDAGGKLTADPHYPNVSFAGDLVVDSPDGGHANEIAGEPGTRAFYITAGTLIIVR